MAIKPVFGEKSALRMILFFSLPIIGSLLFFIGTKISSKVSVDRCLDNGGKWNFDKKSCVIEVLPAGWQWPSKEDLADTWRDDNADRYTKVIGDFNSDGKVDLAAFLINDEKKKFGIFVWWSNDLTVVPGEVVIEDDPGLGVMGIALQQPEKMKTACGKGYWSCDKDEVPEIEFKSAAIDYFKEGSASSVLYWDDGSKSFKRIWISD